MQKEIKFYYIEKGAYAPRSDKPFVKRENVAIIIRYKRQYLLLSWNQVKYQNSLVTGGIEDNENKEEAVKREVKEETGYYDFKSISELDGINVSRFYAPHKQQNREAIYYPYLVELNTLMKDEISDNEQREHSCIWVNEDKIGGLSLFLNHRMMLDIALKK